MRKTLRLFAIGLMLLIGIIISTTVLVACDINTSSPTSTSAPTSTTAHVHEWSEWDVIKECTCTLEGRKMRYCIICNAAEVDAIDASGHSFGEAVQTVAPTCTETGRCERSCSVCGYTEELSVVPANGHTYATTWSSDGTNHWLQCTVADCTATKDEIAHNWNEWAVQVEPTCKSEGSKHRTCKDCDYEAHETIPAISNAHNYATTWTTNETNHWHQCAVEGCTSTKDVTAHQWNEEDTCITCATYKDPEVKFTWNNGSYSVSGYTGSKTSIIIPSTYQGYPVTSISSSAFDCFYRDGSNSLTSITIPNSVTSIGNNAFCRCSNLTSVTLSNRLTSIGYSAFEGCTNLTSITLPDSLTILEAWAFYGCTSLASITMPDSLTNIGVAAFYNTAYLDTHSENGVLYVGDRLIATKNTISGDYTIKDGTKTITDGAFFECTRLTSITIPDSVTSIGSYAFATCVGLKSITLPNSIKSIGDYVFESCNSLSNITFTGTVSQWQAISKEHGWTYTVYCNDGTITKSGTVTYY